MLTNYQQTYNDAFSILDSDDDLPDSYEEPTQIPAYLNDSRFEHIELPWLANCKPVKIATNKPQIISKEKSQPPARPAKIKIEEPSLNEKDNTKILISQGILTKRDLFFVKSIEDYCSETTLLWFIESLKSKTTPNRLQRSCLAKDFCDVDFKDDQHYLFDRLNVNYYFDLVVIK